MIFYRSHSPEAMKQGRVMADDFYKKEKNRKFSLDAALMAHDIFGIGIEEFHRLTDGEKAALVEFDSFLISSTSIYMDRIICVNGFGETFEEMHEASDCDVLYPDFARKYVEKETGIPFDEKDLKFRENSFGKGSRTRAFRKRYARYIDNARHKCPVCRKTEFESYECGICPECGWYDDWIRVKYPDSREGYRESLNEARAAYKELGFKDD